MATKKNGNSKKQHPVMEMAVETEAGKRAKVRLVDPDNHACWVRAYVDVMHEHGIPLAPSGKPMIPGTAKRGLSAEEKAARKAAKQAEKAAFEAMSDEEKLAYAAEKREERKAKQAAKKQAERDALIAQIKAEIKAGKISLDD